MNIDKEKYELWTSQLDEVVAYYTSFVDGDGMVQELEVTKKIYLTLRQGNRKLRNMQRSDERNIEFYNLSEFSLNQRAVCQTKTVEEIVYENIQKEQLYKAIEILSDIQKRRLILYYFESLTVEEIAVYEDCTYQSIQKSICKAREIIKKNLNWGCVF